MERGQKRDGYAAAAVALGVGFPGVHDCFADGSGRHLRNVFSNFHHLRLIKADPAATKIAIYSKGLLKGLSERVVRNLVSEHRPSGMYWIVACPFEASLSPDKV
jgi:hypothetical protein